MPYEIELSSLLIGYSAKAVRPGESVSMITREFLSTDDGEHFITRVEGIPTAILNALPPNAGARPSQVDHLVAVLRRDRSATVYLNEVPIYGRMRMNRDVEPGTPITKDDIIEIDRLDLGGVEIPADSGVVIILSVGWRKGLFYDLTPLADEDSARDYDLMAALGQIQAQLLFQERFRIDDSAWQRMFASGWYPFVALGSTIIAAMVGHANAQWDLDEFTDKAANHIESSLGDWVRTWRSNEIYRNHVDLLERAIEQFRKAEYESCVALAYPRIEGLLRAYYRATGQSGKPSDPKLVVTALEQAPYASVVIPNRYIQYLQEVYFCNYDPRERDPEGLSRHSFGHGEAPANAYDKKAAVITLLNAHQLGMAFRPPGNDGCASIVDENEDAEKPNHALQPSPEDGRG